jgi:UDP-galactopyranose mutase
MSLEFDYLIVGAGLSGLVLAERLSTICGKRSLIVDRRSHIGGNCYDEYDGSGVLVHVYGPHYFRTNSPAIVDYLSQFTEWKPVDYKILSRSDGRFWNFPINLNTYEQLVGRSATEAEFADYLERKRVPIATPRNSEEVIVSQVGTELFELFFRGYTLKQWGKEPRELDASVCGRIPIRTNRDDRYLKENFQALPAEGYSRMFQRMLQRCGGNVKVLLKTDYREVRSAVKSSHLIYTGPIDEYFDYAEGELPYRSLKFEPRSFSAGELLSREAISGRKGFWQPALQVNYPNEEAFTRIVELKHATGQACENTTIVREYPDNYVRGKEAYYPIPAPASQQIFKRYEERAALESRVSFVGRLATYRYYNMDQIIGAALVEFEKLAAVHGNLHRDSALLRRTAA